MTDRIQIGRKGEDMAARYLENRGWKILERNWRAGHKEIDIIASTGRTLVIVEVKLRRFNIEERLDEIIPPIKQQNLVHAAMAYLACRKLKMDLRFDIVLVTGTTGTHQVTHIENAFNNWEI